MASGWGGARRGAGRPKKPVVHHVKLVKPVRLVSPNEPPPRIRVRLKGPIKACALCGRLTLRRGKYCSNGCNDKSYRKQVAIGCRHYQWRQKHGPLMDDPLFVEMLKGRHLVEAMLKSGRSKAEYVEV